MSIAVVTGANSGIGLATALRLAADGRTVWAGSRGEEGLAVIAAAAGTSDLRPLPLDVVDDASVAEAFGRVRAESGDPDILVNNAGVAAAAVVEEATVEDYRSMMDTNFLGTVRCTKQVLPAMREAAGGHIVNLSSLAGISPPPTMSAYAATKWAVEGFSESLQAEVAPFGIRVLVVQPGTILTPIWKKSDALPADTAYPGAYRYLVDFLSHSLPRGAPPEAVADAIVARITADEHRFRLPVWWDAEQLARVRRERGEGEFMAMWFRAEDQVGFRAEHVRVTGIDLWGRSG